MYDMIIYRKKSESGKDLLIKKILQHDLTKNISNLNYKDLLKWSEIIPNIKANIKCEPKTQHPAICPSCENTFPSKYKLTMHLKTNPDCNLINLIHKSTPLSCPNPNCDKWCANEMELNKHILYHCHLTNEEKAFFTNPNPDDLFINRKI